MTKMYLKSFLTVIFTLGLIACSSQAETLQILHVNDLHAQVQGNHELDPELKKRTGGYARVKALMDQVRTNAESLGHQTLTLDAGDNLEGGHHYFAHGGQRVLELLNSMGFEASVIGNHDFLMGPQELERLSSLVGRNYHFLGANFEVESSLPHLRQSIRPWIIVNKGDLKIGILGLTTDSPLYSWTIEDGGQVKITDPIRVARKEIAKLKDQTDFIIALTHLGLKDDRKLVQKTEGIDLVVGGHSHTYLEKPEWVKNRADQMVPIVQAGEHGHVVGSLLVKLERGQPLEIKNYQLLVVDDQTRPDASVAQEVEQIEDELQVEYAGWIDRSFAHSPIPLRRPLEGPTFWGNQFTEGIREAARSDIALTIANFQGVDQPAGKVSGETIMALFPRQFEVDQKMGYSVWKGQILGSALEFGLRHAIARNAPFTMTGIRFDLHRVGNKTKIKNLRINGRPLKKFKRYTIAMTEAVARGAKNLTDFHWLVFQGVEDTAIPVWQAAADQFRRIRPLSGIFQGSQVSATDFLNADSVYFPMH